MPTNQLPDGTCLSPLDRTRLLITLDQLAASFSKTSRRNYDRLEYHAENIPLTILHPGGSTAQFTVCARNLSCGGISLLYAGFIHLDANCELVLTDLEGNKRHLIGRIASCRHVYRRVHEIGVEFHEMIDVDQFVLPSAPVKSCVAPRPGIPHLSGSVLLVTGKEAEARVIQRRIQPTGMQSYIVDSIGKGMDALRRMRFTMAIIEFNMNTGAEDPKDAVKRLRDAGFTGPLVALADKQADIPEEIIGKLAVYERLLRPVGSERLYEIMEDCFTSFDLSREVDPIFSTRPMQSGKDEQLVRYFVSLANQAAEQIHDAVAENDPKRLVKIITSISSISSGYGFAILADATREALQNLKGKELTEETTAAALEVAGLCARLRTGQPEDEGELRQAG